MEFITRGESVTFFHFPHAASLRRVWSWQKYPYAEPSLERMAYHEAGHVVLLEWLGLDSPRAVATTTDGLTQLPAHGEVVAPPDPTGELAAVAAAMFHAGIAAELIHFGMHWHGPIYLLHDDHKRAEALLRAVFGAHSSGAHAFAQRVALHVLSQRWGRVQEIAAVLADKGEWSAQ
ncbi:hypothetical protein [Acidovorax radicis]|uniref:hypothetical protein n=1 Tax=Acidovorax radicis TaxID=758826 RepID=UPI001CFAFBF8|nr:hypothetical protein [Acidovorax radicis]UCV00319.1 hypothetical protein KI609_05915 [Acidovorax radicis]